MTELGPVVTDYPDWHPLLCVQSPDGVHPPEPQAFDVAYAGHDHTIKFVSGFVTCPHATTRLLQSVSQAFDNTDGRLTYQELNFPLYTPDVRPVLVDGRGLWNCPLNKDHSVSTREVMGRALTHELGMWPLAQYGASWNDMRCALRGTPFGSMSSLFVNRTTGGVLKRVWDTLVDAQTWGPQRAR